MATRNVVLVVVLLAVAPIGRASAQGLGDAAKKEKARRTDGSAQPVRVYTNDNVSGVADGAGSKGTFSAPGGSVAPPATIDPAPSSRAAASATTSPAGGKGEDYWRDRMARAQAAVAAADARLAAVERKATADALQGPSNFDCMPTKNPKETFTAYYERARKEKERCERWGAEHPELKTENQLTAARQAAAAAHRELEQTIPEEARRAGALPGWLR
jgi:hypothetical protein